MTEEQKSTAAQDVIYLAGCAVNGDTPDPERLSDLDAVYSVASEHMLSAAVAIALERAGLKDNRSAAVISSVIERRFLYEREYGRVKAELEAAGIWYMPLKGAVLQYCYPVPEMREYADHDILIDAERAGDVRRIMKTLGYASKPTDSLCHDVFFKEPFFIFEMHSALFGKGFVPDTVFDYYRDTASRLIGEGFEKRFSAEDLYLYLLAHEYMHYSAGGTGLRSVLDIYVYVSRVSLNWDYIASELEKLGLSDFEKANRFLAQHLFGGGETTEADREMLDYIVSSGVFGTLRNIVEKQLAENGGSRWRYFLSRLTLPYDAMRERYPVLKKWPCLYPVCWTYRLVHGVAFKRRKVLYQLRGVFGLKLK